MNSDGTQPKPFPCVHCGREIRPAEERDDYPPDVIWVHTRGLGGRINRYCPKMVDGKWRLAIPRGKE